jgi:hypothetical protein
MNVEIGAEAAQFPENEYIQWDFHCSVETEQKGRPGDNFLLPLSPAGHSEGGPLNA